MKTPHRVVENCFCTFGSVQLSYTPRKDELPQPVLELHLSSPDFANNVGACLGISPFATGIVGNIQVMHVLCISRWLDIAEEAMLCGALQRW